MTENGWPPDTNKVVAISLNDCELVTVPGTGRNLKLWFQKGIPAIILPAILADLNQYVESANNTRGYTDEGSWTNGNSVKSSNHNGASAFDYNWDDHPMGVALAGWHGSDIIAGEEEPEIRRILSFYTWNGVQMVWWANDWQTPKDSMHFQMGYGTYENQLNCWDFINNRIRADGFSTYRRGGTARGGHQAEPEHPQVDLIKLVADAMGNVPGVDYTALTPYVRDCLHKSDCTSNNRIAMWFAQIGHESVGLKYMKEIWGPTAAQLTYQGRMGNNNPGDGERYMGRGPIQITGKDNYRSLSQWAFSHGYAPTATYFVDNPAALEQYQYAFLGAVWYWTVARSDINSLCDAGDVVTVTHRINGGDTGLEDRENRWNHCRQLDLTPLIGEDDEMSAEDSKLLRELHDRIIGIPWFDGQWPSLAWTRDSDDEKAGDTVQVMRLALSVSWDQSVAQFAKDGVPQFVKKIERLARGDGPEGDNPDAVEWAQKILEQVPADARTDYKPPPAKKTAAKKKPVKS